MSSQTNLYAALKVITETPKIKQFLRRNDPRAYKQCLKAIRQHEDLLFAEASSISGAD